MNSIFVGAPCGKVPVCDGFYDCLYKLDLPSNSHIERVKGGCLSANRNKIVELALLGDYSHIFLMDDDILFEPSIVKKLLSHNVDVVAGVCTQRNPPFKPYVWGSVDESGRLGFLDIKGKTGCEQVLAVGMAGILFKSEVFKKIQYPWFQEGLDESGIHWTDDIIFSKKLINAEIPVHCDFDVNMWHKVEGLVAWEEGKTVIRFDNTNIYLNL